MEAHTIVRDQLTTADEQAAIREGRQKQGSLKRDAVTVDAVVSTIGFPLVGGPAGASHNLKKLSSSGSSFPCSFGLPLWVSLCRGTR